MSHSIHRVIEALYAAERCPRLHINAIFEGVECPDFVREKWQERLVIDLDTNYPLNLALEQDGVFVDLSFGGHVSRCAFPWNAIYAVSDRATGRGMMFEENIPSSLQESTASSTSPVPKEKPSETSPPPLQAIKGRPLTQNTNVSSESPTEPSDEASTQQTSPEEEEKVKKRRAAFRVIDGGA